MTYKYPGEDPTDVLGAAFAVDDARTLLSKISTSWSHSASRLSAPNTWKGDAAAAANEDVKRLKTILTESTTNLGKIYNAMTTYSSALGTLRMRVDTLNESLLKAQSLLRTGQSDVHMAHVDQQTGDLTPGGVKTLSSDGGVAIRKAERAMTALDADYARILRDQKHAADTCMAALRTLPDGSTVTTGTNYTAALDKALGLSKLNLPPLLKAESDAKTLAGDKQPLDPHDPATQAKIKELNAILAAHHGDAGFDTSFLSNLTPAGVVKLSSVLETMYHGTKPPAIMATVGALQKQFADAVATSTRHIGEPGQLSQNWVDQLKKAGKSEQTFKVGGTIGSVTIRGYVPLMATLGNGSGYSADFMNQLGNDMKSFEQSHGGSACWLPDGTGGPPPPRAAGRPVSSR